MFRGYEGPYPHALKTYAAGLEDLGTDKKIARSDKRKATSLLGKSDAKISETNDLYAKHDNGVQIGVS